MPQILLGKKKEKKTNHCAYIWSVDLPNSRMRNSLKECSAECSELRNLPTLRDLGVFFIANLGIFQVTFSKISLLRI